MGRDDDAATPSARAGRGMINRTGAHYTFGDIILSVPAIGCDAALEVVRLVVCIKMERQDTRARQGHTDKSATTAGAVGFIFVTRYNSVPEASKNRDLMERS